MEKQPPFLTLNNYFRSKYSRRIQKITVSLPFTCPNIDGTKGTEGCIYCREGSIPAGNEKNIPLKEQITAGVAKGKAKYGPGTGFLVYFQTNTNTYASIDKLRSYYDVLSYFPEVIGMDIGTRPDCFEDNVLDLISSYRQKMDEIWVEFGLQSGSDRTLKKINRGHSVSDFVNAAHRARGKNIKTAAHIILGFPWETRSDMINTARLLARTGIDAVKIHPLHVMEGTGLAAMYEKEEFRLLSIGQYVEIAAEVIKTLPPETVIMRFTAEGDRDKLIAPEYCVPEYKGVIRDMLFEKLTAS